MVNFGQNLSTFVCGDRFTILADLLTTVEEPKLESFLYRIYSSNSILALLMLSSATKQVSRLRTIELLNIQLS